MSLVIENLTKAYQHQLAVNDISFSVEAGQIVGFLGPNGAGKSTTMKVATTFLPPSSGRVSVGGFDVSENPMAVRRITGYLPEHNPLYTDMYVQEYLRFIGRLHGMKGTVLKNRVGEMIDRCGLAPEQHKKIEALSKGYRQRVGLAQALLHDPQVLILDEPTSGLDPNQLAEIRKLIHEVSARKTVILSTHIMQEVQALCNRVVVINKGRIAANDTLENLIKRKSGVTVVAEFSEAVPLGELQNMGDVTRVEQAGTNKYRLFSSGAQDIRQAVFKFASEKQLTLLGLTTEESSLESVFRELTENSETA